MFVFSFGGHSLWGAMAAKYASAHQGAISGLMLLSADPTDSLGDGYPVLSLYGSNDDVLNLEKYNSAKPLAPALQFFKEHPLAARCI